MFMCYTKLSSVKIFIYSEQKPFLILWPEASAQWQNERLISNRIFAHLATLQLTRSTSSKSTHPSLSLCPLCCKPQDYCLGFLPCLILGSTSLNLLIYWCLHESTISAPFYIKHVCLNYRNLKSEKPSFELDILDPR